MFIKSQDGDVIFPLSDKGLFKGAIYTEDLCINGRFCGTNIYGKRLFKSYLLGTYEEGEAELVVSEIYKLLKAGIKFYSMPAPTLDLDELGVTL